MPVDARPAVLWWELLDPLKVRSSASACKSVYFVSYARSAARRTEVSLYKTDANVQGEWVRVLRAARVHCDPDEHTALRHGLLVAVDEPAHCAVVIYLRNDVDARQTLCLRKFALGREDDSPVYELSESLSALLPDCLKGHGGRLEMNELLVRGKSWLLACSVIALESGPKSHVSVAADGLALLTPAKRMSYDGDVLFLLKTEAPRRLLVSAVDSSVTSEQNALFLSHLSYKKMRVFIRRNNMLGAFQEIGQAPIPPLPNPVVLSAAAADSCTIFADDTGLPANQAAILQITGYISDEPEERGWTVLAVFRGWLLISNDEQTVYAIRGWHLARPHAIVVRKLSAWTAASKWLSAPGREVLAAVHELWTQPAGMLDGRLIERLCLEPLIGGTQRSYYATQLDLNAWLPEPPCAACQAPHPSAECRLCARKGFARYWWLFGCRFCGAECLQKAWPTHSKLHKLSPLDKWALDDWKQWRRSFNPPLDSL